MSIAQTLLPEFDHEMAGCRQALARVPDSQFDYQPHVKSFTLGQLANHLATIPGYITGTMVTTELDFSLPETRAMMPAPVASQAGLLQVFDQAVIAARAALARATDEQLQVLWSGKNEGQVLFSMPRAAVLRTMVMNHAIHHRAQLCVYLRLLDIPVPAIYGPSADEN